MAGIAFFFFFFFFPFPFLSGRGFPTAGLYLANKNVPVTEDEANAKKRVSEPPQKQTKNPTKKCKPRNLDTANNLSKKRKKGGNEIRYQSIDHRMVAGASQAQGSSFRSVRGHQIEKKKIVPKEANPRFFYSHPPRFWWLLAAGRERNEGSSLASVSEHDTRMHVKKPPIRSVRAYAPAVPLRYLTVPFCVAYVPDGGSRRQHVFHSPSS